MRELNTFAKQSTACTTTNWHSRPKHAWRAWAAASAVALLACTSMLFGCSQGNHQAIMQSEACTSCHDDSRTGVSADEIDLSSTGLSITDTGLSFTLSTSYSEVYLCSATFDTDKPKTVVPVKLSRVSAGEVTAPSAGVYVLATGDEDNPAITVIRASEDGPAGTTVTLG